MLLGVLYVIALTFGFAEVLRDNAAPPRGAGRHC